MGYKRMVPITLILLACILLSPISILAQEEPVEVPIIMYHSLNKKRCDPWTLHPDAFEKDLQYLQENGYEAVLLIDLVEYVEHGVPLPEKPIVLSFDDCYYNNLVYALPMLEQYQMKMVLAIIGNSSEQFSRQKDLNVNYAHLSWEQLCQMQDSGLVELANHTWNMHSNAKGGRYGCCPMRGEDLESYRSIFYNDVRKLQDTILQQCGREPIAFVYPFGNRCPEALAILKEMGFKVTLSCYEGMNYVTPSNPDCLFDMHRVNRTPGKSVESILKNLNKKDKKK